MMNGGSGGNSGDVKYPANCAARISVETNASAAVAVGDGSIDASVLDRLYEPKPNKKVMRVITVIGYIFTVSMVAILLSLYYLFLWNPYIKHHQQTLARQREGLPPLPSQQFDAVNSAHAGGGRQFPSDGADGGRDGGSLVSATLAPFLVLPTGSPTVFPPKTLALRAPQARAEEDTATEELNAAGSHERSLNFKRSSPSSWDPDDRLENPFTLYAKARRTNEQVWEKVYVQKDGKKTKRR